MSQQLTILAGFWLLKSYLFLSWFQIFTNNLLHYVCEYFRIWALKTFYLTKKIIFSPMSGTSRIGHIFRTGADRCLLQMWNSRKTKTSTYFFSFNVHLSFNSWIWLSRFSTECWSTLKFLGHNELIYNSLYVESPQHRKKTII